ncbi:hypothetical protein G9A89_000457 [Geosiphon pyriformis]|nr:hypothetical protein G9A89_000457 [Geosiphon pyriformis]
MVPIRGYWWDATYKEGSPSTLPTTTIKPLKSQYTYMGGLPMYKDTKYTYRVPNHPAQLPYPTNQQQLQSTSTILTTLLNRGTQSSKPPVVGLGVVTLLIPNHYLVLSPRIPPTTTPTNEGSQTGVCKDSGSKKVPMLTNSTIPIGTAINTHSRSNNVSTIMPRPYQLSPPSQGSKWLFILHVLTPTLVGVTNTGVGRILILQGVALGNWVPNPNPNYPHRQGELIGGASPPRGLATSGGASGTQILENPNLSTTKYPYLVVAKTGGGNKPLRLYAAP